MRDLQSWRASRTYSATSPSLLLLTALILGGLPWLESTMAQTSSQGQAITSSPHLAWTEVANATGSLIIGDDSSAASLEVLSPLAFDGRSLLFLYPDLQVREDGLRDLSIGLGFRTFVNDDWIFGANIFYDNTESTNGGTFGQFGAGAELLSQRVRARTNFYFPQGDRRRTNAFRTSATFNETNILGDTTPVVTDPFATGYGIFRETTIDYSIENIVRNESYLFEQFEQGMDGADVEVGFLAPVLDRLGDVWLFGGYHHFDNPFGGSISGPTARAEVQLSQHLIFDAVWVDDKAVSTIGSNWSFGVRATIPLGRHPTDTPETRGLFEGIGRFLAGQEPLPLVPLEDQIGQNIMRNNRVRLAESGPIEDVSARIIDEERTVERIFSQTLTQETVLLPGVSNPGWRDIIFVDANAPAGGNGTAERPFRDLLSAQILADTRFATLGRTQGIYVTSRPTAYTDNITFDRASGRFVLADTSITLPLASGGTFGGGTDRATWTVANSPALMVDGIGQFSFGGFAITSSGGTQPGIQINNVPSPPLPPPPGVIDTEAFHFLGGTTVDSTGGPALVINDSGVSGSVTSLRSSASSAAGVSLTNVTGNLTVTGSVTVEDSTLDGIAIDNTSATFSVLGQSILNGSNSTGIDGIDIQNSSGTFTFASVNIDGWEDGLDFEDNTGQINILGGNIDGSNQNGAEFTDSNVSISSVTFGRTTASGNDAVNVFGVAGSSTYNFTDITIASSMDDGIDLDLNGGSQTFAFTNITIEDSDDNAFDLDGDSGTSTHSFNNVVVQMSGEDGIDIDVTGGTHQYTFQTVSISNTAFDGIYIENFGGTLNADFSDTTINDPGVDGIVFFIQDGSTTTSFTNTTINRPSFDGIFVVNVGGELTTSFTNLTVNTPDDDGIDIVAEDGITNFSVNGGTITNPAVDGFILTGDGGISNTTLTNTTITTPGANGIFAETFFGTHRFSFDQINITEAELDGIFLNGFFGGLLEVNQFSDITIASANVSDTFGLGGIYVDTVTFDADPSTAAIEQVEGGDLRIGSDGSRVSGYGFILYDPTGDIGFGDFDIFNDGSVGGATFPTGTGLYVDTKFGGTTFNLGTTSGTIDTANGPALFLDPLSVAMTLDEVNASNASAEGVFIDEVSGELNIGSVSIMNIEALAGFRMEDSSVNVNVGTLVVDTVIPESIGVSLFNNTGTLTVSGTTTVSSVLVGIDIEDSNVDLQGLTTTFGNSTGIFITGNGSHQFGDADVSDYFSNGIRIFGTTSASFGDINITANSNNTDGISFSGALAEFSASSFSFTGIPAAGMTAVNLSGTQIGTSIILGDPSNPATDTPSSITAADIGIEINNSNGDFVFGDGESVIDIMSTNNALTPVDINGVNTITTNFDDVP